MLAFMENRELDRSPVIRIYLTSLNNTNATISVPANPTEHPPVTVDISPGKATMHQFQFSLHMIGHGSNAKCTLQLRQFVPLLSLSLSLSSLSSLSVCLSVSLSSLSLSLSVCLCVSSSLFLTLSLYPTFFCLYASFHQPYLIGRFRRFAFFVYNCI